MERLSATCGTIVIGYLRTDCFVHFVSRVLFAICGTMVIDYLWHGCSWLFVARLWMAITIANGRLGHDCSWLFVPPWEIALYRSLGPVPAQIIEASGLGGKL